MGGPWEKYATTEAASDGPWSKYAASTAVEPPSDPLYASELAKAKETMSRPPIPGQPGDMPLPSSPEQAATEGVAHIRAQEAEKAAFEATRTPGKRAGDTAAFLASMPVRMATRGEYGAGDVVGAVSPGAGKAMNQAEGDFANANEAGLETAKAAGDVMAGIPLLQSMGAVPGQVLKQGAAAAGQARPIAKAFLRETEGSGPIPGATPPGGSAPPPVAPPAPPAGSTTVKQEGNVMRSAVLGEDGKEVGFVSGSVKDGTLVIDKSTLQGAHQGSGNGIAMYRAIVDAALDKGLRVESAYEVSEKASRMYSALQRRGYQVEALPHRIEDASGSRRIVVTDDLTRRPFAVTAKPNTAGAAPPAGSPPPPPPPGPQAARLPTKNETFEMSDRLNQGIGAKIDIPDMVATDQPWKQTLAAGLKSMPVAGDPVESMFAKGLGQLEVATKKAGETLGTAAGQEATGQGIKQGVSSWINKNSKDFLKERYDEVYATIDPEATRPLRATGRLVNDFGAEMRRSTGTAAQPVIDKVREAVDRPGGLGVKGLSDLRSEVGDLLDESIINNSPNQTALKRAYGALTDDLKASVKEIGGPKALRSWEVANREANIVVGQKKRLARLTGTSEDKLSPEAVFKKLRTWGKKDGGNARDIRLVKQVVGKKEWDDVGAQMIHDMGIDKKTDLYSGDRYLSAYGDMSDAAKQEFFGAARTHLDDIAGIAKKFGQLSSKFNRSNTGIVNTVLKVLNNPTSLALHAYASPLTAAAQGSFLLAGRRLAWSLAKPSSAKKASNVLRSYYGVAKAAGKSAELVAAKEEALAGSIRAMSLDVARETGAKAKDVEATITKELKGAMDELAKPISIDEMEAAIVQLTEGPDGASIAALRAKFPNVSKAEFDKTLKEMNDTGRADFGGRKTK